MMDEELEYNGFDDDEHDTMLDGECMIVESDMNYQRDDAEDGYDYPSDMDDENDPYSEVQSEIDNNDTYSGDYLSD